MRMEGHMGYSMGYSRGTPASAGEAGTAGGWKGTGTVITVARR